MRLGLKATTRVAAHRSAAPSAPAGTWALPTVRSSTRGQPAGGAPLGYSLQTADESVE